MAPDDTAAARLLRTLSFDALRGFEAAARLASFTRAAEELCLTQSAVSKQVKLLEDALGAPLFVRGARGLRLTREGRVLLEGTGAALQRIEDSLAQILPGGREAVSISVTPSFASLWLAPALAAWRAEQPGVDIRIHAAEANVALEREGLDLALRLAPGDVPGKAPAAPGELLARERLLLVAAPALAAQVKQPSDLAAQALLVFRHPVERHRGMAWAHWFQRLGVTPSASQPRFQFSHYEHALKAAIEGTGIVIGRLPLVLPALRAGLLQPVLAPFQLEGLGYRLIVGERGRTRPAVQAFAAWIADALARDAG